MWFPWAAMLFASLLAPPWASVVTLRAPKSDRVRVPQGSFAMGSTADEMLEALNLCKREMLGPKCDDPDLTSAIRREGHAHTVTLRAFDIDRTEVTVRAYQRCVHAAYCAPAGIPDDARYSRGDLPVSMVRKIDAESYCAFAGGRLPTEAEWEFAARGPSRRRYPWGNLYNPRLLNHGSFASDAHDASDGHELLAPVGSFPDGAGPFGTLDQAGNVAEWVADGFTQPTEDGFGYEPSAKQNPRVTGVFNIVRGGAFDRGAPWQRGASRTLVSISRAPGIGIRCAYDIP